MVRAGRAAVLSITGHLRPVASHHDQDFVERCRSGTPAAGGRLALDRSAVTSAEVLS
jgi:hypothetical protein